MKKKVLSVLTGVVLGTVVAASAALAADVTTVSEGKLKVATSPDFAPYDQHSVPYCSQMSIPTFQKKVG